jgi:hypothetical protein
MKKYNDIQQLFNQWKTKERENIRLSDLDTGWALYSEADLIDFAMFVHSSLGGDIPD